MNNPAHSSQPTSRREFLEHVLLGLLALEDGVVPNVLKKMGVDREGVRQQIENWMGWSRCGT